MLLFVPLASYTSLHAITFLSELVYTASYYTLIIILSYMAKFPYYVKLFFFMIQSQRAHSLVKQVSHYAASPSFTSDPSLASD